MSAPRILLVAAIALALGALGIGGFLHQQTERVATQPVVSQSSGAVPSAPIEPETTAEQSATPKISKERMDELIAQGVVNAEFVDYAQMGEADPRFQERFYVLKRRGVSDTEPCAKIQLTEESHTCWNDYQYNPYFAYNSDTLRNLADTDALAAAVLALKLEAGKQREESLYYRLLSAQLSGKPGPLVQYLRTQSVSLGPDGKSIVNLDHALEKFAVAVLVDQMGYPYMFAPELQRSMRRSGVSQDLLDQTAVQSANLMRGIGGQP